MVGDKRTTSPIAVGRQLDALERPLQLQIQVAWHVPSGRLALAAALLLDDTVITSREYLHCHVAVSGPLLRGLENRNVLLDRSRRIERSEDRRIGTRSFSSAGTGS